MTRLCCSQVRICLNNWPDLSELKLVETMIELLTLMPRVLEYQSSNPRPIKSDTMLKKSSPRQTFTQASVIVLTLRYGVGHL